MLSTEHPGSQQLFLYDVSGTRKDDNNCSQDTFVFQRFAGDTFQKHQVKNLEVLTSSTMKVVPDASKLPEVGQ